MGDIKVSVCCLAYNHEKYIRKTLDGFIMQKTNFKFEVIVHDDASTDYTKEIINEYVEKYPDIFVPIYQKENQYRKVKLGITGSILLPRARGEYVAFCEGDDYWCDSYKLQKQYDIMEKNKDCSICVHKVQCMNEDGSLNNSTFPEEKYELQNGKISQDEVAKILWNGYIWQTSSYFLRKNVLRDWIEDKIPFDNKMHGDMKMLLLSLVNGCFYYISDKMSCYRLQAKGSFNTNWGKIENKVDYYATEAENRYKIDVYTKFQYHKYILPGIIGYVFYISSYDAIYGKSLLKKYGIKLKDVYTAFGFTTSLKYMMFQMAPSLVDKINRWRRKQK